MVSPATGEDDLTPRGRPAACASTDHTPPERGHGVRGDVEPNCHLINKTAPYGSTHVSYLLTPPCCNAIVELILVPTYSLSSSSFVFSVGDHAMGAECGDVAYVNSPASMLSRHWYSTNGAKVTSETAATSHMVRH